MVDWEQRIADEGLRVTAPRRAVIEVISQTKKPLSPQDVLEQARVHHHDLGLVTVYRVLNLLLELKLVRRVHFEHGCHCYLPASPGHYHTLICQHCGRATEFIGENDIAPLIARIEAQTGYDIQDHLLQLFGQCPACQKGQQ